MEVLDPCDLSPFVCRSFFSPFIDESKDMESQWGGSGFALGDLAMQCFGGSYLFTGLYPRGQTLHISSLGVLALTRSIFQFPILSGHQQEKHLPTIHTRTGIRAPRKGKTGKGYRVAHPGPPWNGFQTSHTGECSRVQDTEDIPRGRQQVHQGASPLPTSTGLLKRFL